MGLDQLGGVNWGAIAPQTGSMITVALVSLLSLVLSNSGIELVVGQDLNLNTELRSIGLASLIAGFGSGMVGNQALPSTLLVHNIGGHSRLTGAIAALPCLAVLALGSGFLAYFPKPVLGCLLLYLGLTLLYKWLIQSWAILPRMDYLTVVAMVVAINLLGFLQGIAVGFILSVLLFMYHYSHVDVAKEVLSGATTRSNVERTGAELAQLQKQGDRIFILELQGFLFFGTANYLLKQVKQRLGDGEPLQFIVLDFRQVTGVDASAVLSCRKIRTLAQQQKITLVFTNLAPAFRSPLEQGGAIPPRENYCSLEGTCQFFDDIDRGLEWCENLLLAASPGIEGDFKTILVEKFLPPEAVEAFCAYLEPVTLAAGERVYDQEEAIAHRATITNHLYFVASGRVSVLLELPDGKTKRLQTVTQGNVLGEMRFYGKPPLSNAVVAEVETQLYGLSQASFQEMQQAHPALARQLEGYIVRILCDSLTRREQQLRVMR